MSVFVLNEKVVKSDGYGAAITKAIKSYVKPELKRRKLTQFLAAGIEIFPDGQSKVYLDDEVKLCIESKKRKFDPRDAGKQLNIDLQEIKSFTWVQDNLTPESAKIMIARFNKDWWVWSATFNGNKKLEQKFAAISTYRVRLSGYMSLDDRKKEKAKFFKDYQQNVQQNLPAMWRRHLTVKHRYSGVMAYDGNYYDLFTHAQQLYTLGYYYSATIICRAAAEQALILILTNGGQGLEIYKSEHGKRKLKSIEQLTVTCRSVSLFGRKGLITQNAAGKLNAISTIASALIHPKHDIEHNKYYKVGSLKCMDNLHYIIKNYLNFIKDKRVYSGYKPVGSSTRLK